mgnify:CR=1 FL=1
MDACDVIVEIFNYFSARGTNLRKFFVIWVNFFMSYRSFSVVGEKFAVTTFKLTTITVNSYSVLLQLHKILVAVLAESVSGNELFADPFGCFFLCWFLDNFTTQIWLFTWLFFDQNQLMIFNIFFLIILEVTSVILQFWWWSFFTIYVIFGCWDWANFVDVLCETLSDNLRELSLICGEFILELPKLIDSFLA